MKKKHAVYRNISRRGHATVLYLFDMSDMKCEIGFMVQQHYMMTSKAFARVFIFQPCA